MALTPEQQAELDRLQEEAKKPEPRTETGVAGVLHALIDSASGAVAHRGAEDWAALHKQAEGTAPTPEPEPPAAEPKPSIAATAPTQAAAPVYGTESSSFTG